MRYHKKCFLVTVFLMIFTMVFSFQNPVTVSASPDVSEEEGNIRFKELQDFQGTTVGLPTGSTLDKFFSEKVPDLEFKYYEDNASVLLALSSGTLDAMAADLPVAELAVKRRPELAIFPEKIAEDQYGFGFAKGDPLRDDVNELIAKYREDGTLDALREKWTSSDDSIKTIDMGEYDAPNGTLRYAHDSTTEPMSYVGSHGESLGMEVELVSMLAKELGYKLEITQVNFNALISMLTSGRVDIASGAMSITEERKKSIDFSDTHYVGGMAVIVRAEDLGIQVAQEKQGFFEKVSGSFYNNFIKESRWKMICSGFGITFVISIFSAVFGTVLGFLICMVRRSRNRVLSGIAGAFIRLIQGIPVLVLLMVLFYVIFAGTSVSDIVISVIAFSINFGVYVSEMIRTGINAVDQGQWEAAVALGFGRVKTFTKIIAPQALKHILPVYKGEFISMIKMTSVVGYIAVQDLTKVTDIIRSRTFDAFFPLIVTAAIYFLLAWGLTCLLDRFEKRINPKHRRRILKGIDRNVNIKDGVQYQPAKDEKDVVISVSHLKKQYPNVTPLKDINTEIKRGEVISIIGPSGTGKSTFLRCLNRLETPTDGKIEILKQEMIHAKNAQLSAVRRKMGMVFQSFNLFPHLTVIENVMLAPVQLLKVAPQEAYNNGMKLLQSVGLAEKAFNYPDELSGGQKQRVAIARTLGMKPEIILFDEPTSALDPTMVGEVLSVIRNLASCGLTMLIVTHEMKFARDVSSRVFYMDEGLIYEEGTPQQIFGEPKTSHCRAFIKHLKTLRIEIDAKTFDFIGAVGEIDRFARKHTLGAKQSVKYQQIFEELCYTVLLAQMPDQGDWVIVFEAACKEDGSECEVNIGWEGESYNPLTEGDRLSLALALSKTTSSRYDYKDGKNRVHIVFA